jgi:hypothetical protein
LDGQLEVGDGLFVKALGVELEAGLVIVLRGEGDGVPARGQETKSEDRQELPHRSPGFKDPSQDPIGIGVRVPV